MTTTLTQVSNVFNLLCQLDARLLNYHFGWQWDINKEIDNNFDPGNKTGRLFPAVQMDVPDYFQAIEEPNYNGTKEEIKIQLYFYDEQDYNNDSSSKTTNLIEQWTNLKTIAEDFIANYIEAIGPKKYNIGFITNPRYTQRSNLHNDRLILWEVEFVLTHIAPCTEVLNKIDLDLLPETLQLPDLERITVPPPPCFSLDLDGVNEYIEAPINSAFDLGRLDQMSFEVWVKFDSFKLIDHLIAKYQVGKGIVFAVFNNELRFDLQNNSTTNRITKYSTGAVITTGVWYNFAVTYDGSGFASGVKMFKNGIQLSDGLTVDTLTGSIINIESVKIGAFASAGFYSSAIFNAARWWDKELNQTEITYQYNNRTKTPLQAANLILNTDIQNSTWNGIEFDIPDLTGITAGYTTINAEEEDKVEDCPS